MKNILIVDDERMFLMSLSESLIQSLKGFNVFTAENGEEAIKILGSRPVNLLITDLQMPGKNGFDLLKHVKDFFPDMSVIVISAYINVDMMKGLKSLGFSQILEKPIDFEDLIGKIKAEITKKGG